MQRLAVIIGATGGIGSAIATVAEVSDRYDRVIRLSRTSSPSLELLDEASIEAAARWLKEQPGEIAFILDATGALTLGDHKPEKSWRELDPSALADTFALNAIGPALFMKHFLPLMPRDGRSIFATLSARVGSISDNQLGGWYGYRAAKAALNQLVRTASVELKRKKPEAICVALHPGTVRTQLTEGFAKTGLEVQDPEQAAKRLLTVVEGLRPEDTGGFFDHLGKPVSW
ncbi:MAG: SDR family NAD(P)-dependent oxidoreductase [Roseibium sp.]